MTSRFLRTLASAAGLSALVALALCGCAEASFSAGDSPTNAATVVPTKSVFALEIGDCVDDTDEVELQHLPLVDCADPHDYEVFDEYQIPDGDYPGDDVITEIALGYCSGAMESFVGVAYEASALDINYLTPTEDSWTNGGDRQISCLVFDPAGKVSGTLQGAAR
ncbi:MAG: hypothetical protein EPO52_03485 [Herbiconiux sp.]|uniref:septum formation family protein n=1 Tax=Herbiconiux sp. TaxID=1871186 RepID=UPI00120F6948|nr:septum formation family protein [Herbiconiux sp.]TAJ49351.1 MAG: hypothetical protein EPO52_03485 [Herbiconiux sp.]